MRRFARALSFVALAAGAAGCSLLLDWGDLSGGADAGDRPDARAGDAGVDARLDGAGLDALASCGTSAVCTPPGPTGWTGPVALHAGPGAAPGCPGGAALFEGQADLQIPAPTCAACACGAATGVGCSGPVVTFFQAPDCTSPVGGPVTATNKCASTPTGSFGAKVAGPAPQGGACAASGGGGTVAPTSWGSSVVACPLTAATGSCANGAACVVAPPSGFGAQPCVFQAGAATSCPADYPVGPQIVFTGVDDTRACSPCSCGAPRGGACAVASPAIDVYAPFSSCTGSVATTLDAPSACQAFAGSAPIRAIADPTLVDAGACGVADGGATGAAMPTGATSFCCAP